MSVLTSGNRSTAALYNWLYGVLSLKQQIGRAHELQLDAGNNTIAIKSQWVKRTAMSGSAVTKSLCYLKPMLYPAD